MWTTQDADTNMWVDGDHQEICRKSIRNSLRNVDDEDEDEDEDQETMNIEHPTNLGS